MYSLIRSLLFMLPPEDAHYAAMNLLKTCSSIGFIKDAIRKNFTAEHPQLHTTLFGLDFKNPLGLAAGFDKNAKYLRELELLGFGFVETGTVTPKPQPGNEKPRLFRLTKDKALINRMGFNNDGADAVRENIAFYLNEKCKMQNEKTQSTHQKSINQKLIVGGNIGKNKVTENDAAWKDYVYCFNALFDVVDYFVVNVSSPNTPGLRALQEKDSLRKIFAELNNQNIKYNKQKPVLLKIAPDLNKEQLDDVISLALEIKLEGLVATNTTISRENLITPKQEVDKIGAGGLSGKPVTARATEVIQYIAQQTNKQIPVIASGGIFTAADAKEKLNAGAELVQVWTGFIYEGPKIAKNICEELVR